MKKVPERRNTLTIAGLSSLALLVSSGNASYAQGTISDKAMEKSHFYQAPREYQIIDDRPVVRDFREAPATGNQMNIPNGPGGGQGAGGLGGIGGGSGANPVIPSNGLQIGGANTPAYRNDPTGMSSLPKSGFGGSNIPAGGLGPRGILPGVSMGVVGKLMSQNKPAQPATTSAMRGVPGKGIGPGSGTAASGPPAVTSYGGYNNVTNYGSSNMRTEQNVRGHLLRK